MTAVFELLLAVSLLGLVDVGYFHLYRFRLYARPESVGEEITHLVRHLVFLGVVATLLFVRQVDLAARLILGLFAVDLVNSAADVLLERRSREGLGGLPSLEYLLHLLASLGIGAIVATFWWHRGEAIALDPGQLLRGYASLAGGVVLFAVEATLFARALAARRPALRFACC